MVPSIVPLWILLLLALHVRGLWGLDVCLRHYRHYKENSGTVTSFYCLHGCCGGDFDRYCCEVMSTAQAAGVAVGLVVVVGVVLGGLVVLARHRSLHCPLPLCQELVDVVVDPNSKEEDEIREDKVTSQAASRPHPPPRQRSGGGLSVPAFIGQPPVLVTPSPVRSAIAFYNAKATQGVNPPPYTPCDPLSQQDRGRVVKRAPPSNDDAREVDDVEKKRKKKVSEGENKRKKKVSEEEDKRKKTVSEEENKRKKTVSEEEDKRKKRVSEEENKRTLKVSERENKRQEKVSDGEDNGKKKAEQEAADGDTRHERNKGKVVREEERTGEDTASKTSDDSDEYPDSYDVVTIKPLKARTVKSYAGKVVKAIHTSESTTKLIMDDDKLCNPISKAKKDRSTPPPKTPKPSQLSKPVTRKITVNFNSSGLSSDESDTTIGANSTASTDTKFSTYVVPKNREKTSEVSELPELPVSRQSSGAGDSASSSYSTTTVASSEAFARAPSPTRRKSVSRFSTFTLVKKARRSKKTAMTQLAVVSDSRAAAAAAATPKVRRQESKITDTFRNMRDAVRRKSSARSPNSFRSLGPRMPVKRATLRHRKGRSAPARLVDPIRKFFRKSSFDQV